MIKYKNTILACFSYVLTIQIDHSSRAYRASHLAAWGSADGSHKTQSHSQPPAARAALSQLTSHNQPRRAAQPAALRATGAMRWCAWHLHFWLQMDLTLHFSRLQQTSPRAVRRNARRTIPRPSCPTRARYALRTRVLPFPSHRFFYEPCSGGFVLVRVSIANSPWRVA